MAGEVVEVGSHITRFKTSDRVIGHAIGQAENHNSPSEGAFQTFTVLQAHMTSPIPSDLSYEKASVIPLAVSTASCGLFQKDMLALQHPSTHSEPTGKTLLIWGGSTSVGSNAIQLAVAAGHDVFTTASPKNFGFVKSLGAAKAFDYNGTTVVADLVQAFEGKITIGALSIGPGSADSCMSVLSKCKGNKLIATANYFVPSTPPKRFVTLRTIYYFISWSISHWIKSKTTGVNYKFIFGTTLIDNGVGKAIYEDYLPEALADGKFVAAPEPVIAGRGLESVQKWIRQAEARLVSEKRGCLSIAQRMINGSREEI